MRDRSDPPSSPASWQPVVSAGLWAIFAAILLSGTVGATRAFDGAQTAADVRVQAVAAMARIVATARQAVGLDDTWPPCASRGATAAGLRFRPLRAVSAGGQPVYDDRSAVWIRGPDPTPPAVAGLIIGRGPTLEDIHGAAAGPDGVLGTADDDEAASLDGDTPAVEVVLPSSYAPRGGAMLDVQVCEDRRLLTVTLRVNARHPDGGYLLEEDLVMSERVALRQ